MFIVFLSSVLLFDAKTKHFYHHITRLFSEKLLSHNAFGDFHKETCFMDY